MWQNNYNYYLYHHGILGQRWGKKNGPPYPLGSSDHSASEKKAGWRKSLDKQGKSSHTKSSNVSKSSDNSEKDGFYLTDKQKKALKIGAAAVAASLAAYGTYKLVQSGKLNDLAAIGKARVDAMLGKKAGGVSELVDPVTGLKVKHPNQVSSLYDDVKAVNPNFNSGEGYRHNCVNNTIALALRQMGFDVEAKPSTTKNFVETVNKCFEGVKPLYITASKQNAQDRVIKNILKRYSEGDMGGITVRFDNRLTKGNVDCSHAFSWKIINGVVNFLDTQPNPPLMDASKYLSKISDNSEITVVKLNGLKLKVDGIKEMVTSK